MIHLHARWARRIARELWKVPSRKYGRCASRRDHQSGVGVEARASRDHRADADAHLGRTA